MISKQDGVAPRTAADIERKYNFGKSFAEVMGYATDAKEAAEAAEEAAEKAVKAYEGLDQEQIFNLLTNNGEAQGVYRGEDGQIYINANYLKSGKIDASVIEVINLIAEKLHCADGDFVIDIENGKIISKSTKEPGLKLLHLSSTTVTPIETGEEFLSGEVALTGKDPNMTYWSVLTGRDITMSTEATETQPKFLASFSPYQLALHKVDDNGRNCKISYDPTHGWRISFDNQPMADFIVEQGVTNYWTYRKWNSGIVECWRSITNVPTVTGGSFNNFAIEFPFLFASTDYVVQMTKNRHGQFVTDVGDCNHNGEINHELSGFVASYYYTGTTAYTVGFNVNVIGRWK